MVVVLLGIGFVPAAPTPVDAGMFEKFKSSARNTGRTIGNRTRSTGRSVGNRVRNTGRTMTNRARSGASRVGRSVRNTSRNFIDRTKRVTRDTVNRGTSSLRDTSRRTFDKAKQASRGASSGIKDRMRDVGKRAIEKTRQGTASRVDGIKEKTRDFVDRSRSAASRTVRKSLGERTTASLGRARQKVATTVHDTLDRTLKSLRRPAKSIASRTVTLTEAARKLSGRARQAFAERTKDFRDDTKVVIAEYLDRTKDAGARTLERTGTLLHRVEDYVSDPARQRRAVAAALIASGAAMAAYQHKDDIQYLVIRATMERVQVPTRDGLKPADDAYRDFILQRAPYLAGTRIANDPSALLAYGVVEVGKDDFINNVPLIADGRGGAVPIGSAIRNTSGSGEALALLNLEASVEGMAIDAAANGHLGRGPRDFAVAYQNTDAAINRRLPN